MSVHHRNEEDKEPNIASTKSDSNTMNEESKRNSSRRRRSITPTKSQSPPAESLNNNNCSGRRRRRESFKRNRFHNSREVNNNDGSENAVDYSWKAKYDELRKEMEEMRSLSEGELFKAWGEIEELHDQKEELLEQNQELFKEVQKARKREDYLFKKLQKSEELRKQQKQQQQSQPQLKDEEGISKENDICDIDKSSAANNKSSGSIGGIDFRSIFSSISQHSRTCSIANKRGSTATISTSSMSASRRSSESEISMSESLQSMLQEISGREQQSESEYVERIRDLEEEKDEIIREWEAKVRSRDVILESLEKASQIQGENLDAMRRKVIQVGLSFKEREKQYVNQIEAFQQKVNEKRKTVAKQHKKLKIYAAQIEELSSQLQDVVVSSITTVKDNNNKVENVENNTDVHLPVQQQQQRQPSSSLGTNSIKLLVRMREDDYKKRRKKRTRHYDTAFSPILAKVIQNKTPPLKQRTEAPAMA